MSAVAIRTKREQLPIREEAGTITTNDKGETFGAWLLAQSDREGWVGDLVKAAKTDRQFPRAGTPEDVRKRLRETMAEGDMFEAVDDAESDWISY